MITGIGNKSVKVGEPWYSSLELFQMFTNEDGSPCGVKVEC